MKRIALLILIISCLKLQAQHHELGIGLNGYTGYKTNLQTSDTIIYGHDKRRIAQPVLTYNYINEKNTDFFIHLGYFYQPNTLNEKSSGNKNYSYTRGNYLSKSVYFKLGVGKRFNIDKLYFVSAINIPFEYNYSYKYNITYYYTDSLNRYTGTTYRNEQYAPEIYTGLSLQQSFYYKLFDKFLIGFDLNLAYALSITNGKRTYTYGSVNFTPYAATETTQTINYKFQTQSSLLFQPVVNVRYIMK